MRTHRLRSLDHKVWAWPLGCVVPLSALLPSQLVLHTGQPIFWWSGLLLIFVIVPVVDALIGNDKESVNAIDTVELQNVRFYRWCVWAYLPVQLISLVIAAYLWAQGTLSVVDKLGLAFSVGLAGGVGINAAHELGHRHEKLERRLAKIALAQTMYGHFFVEHNRGHHARVATPEDPASGRLGESLYRFLPRAIVGALTSALRLEAQRLRRTGRPWWHPANHVLNAWSLTVVLFGTLVAVFGVGVLPWLIAQAVIGLVLLEAVNYVEHYGLLRKRKANGRYERCAPEHSWNSDRAVTNVLLFHLQRHSDHHANPQRRYQTLRSWSTAPQLPAGYATMVLMAAVPPVFARVMDPIVAAHYDGDLTRANVAPTRRGRRAVRRQSATIATASEKVAVGR